MAKKFISFEDWCKDNGKPELLALYDRVANVLPPSEIPFSSPKLRHWRCPTCESTWTGAPNKANRWKRATYNAITKKPQITYCPYCHGEHASAMFNMATELPWSVSCWDYDRNDSTPEQHLPSTHKRFYIKCPLCRYKVPQPVRISTLRKGFLCPACSGGKPREVTPDNCLASKYPQIAAELADSRNGGITAYNILPSYNNKLWFRCSQGHMYSARVSNRTYLGRGCPYCKSRMKTSFVEQAVYHYIKLCCDSTQNNIVEKHGHSVDIFLPEQRVAIECNSLYYHATVRPSFPRDIRKYCELAQYYRVYVLTESEKEHRAIQAFDHPLLCSICLPIFSHTNASFVRYNTVIYELLRELFPRQNNYPNIDLKRDQLKILAQYIHCPISGSFEESYPELAADWDTQKNETLRPDMFRPTAPYLFHWICRSCGRSYPASMGNRTKVNPDTCPFCCHESRFKSPLLSESFPQLRPYWSERLNRMPFFEAAVASEKIAAFELADGTVVPCRICQISLWLYSHPNDAPGVYLAAKRDRLKKKYEKQLERFQKEE